MRKKGRMPREFGESVKVRVVANADQFGKWWPEFVRSIGTFPFIGFNCKFNSPNIIRQMRSMGVDPDSKELAQKLMEEVEPAFDYEGDFEGPKSLLEVRDKNARRGAVSLMELASFGGHVLLIRSCFFEQLPCDLVHLLEQTNVAKVGQGLEKDVRHLRESFAVSVNGYLDVRNICLMWPWFTANYSFDKFGVRSVAHFLFGGDYSDYQTSIRSPFYITRLLETEQIRSAAHETQLTVDVLMFVSLRYLGLRLPFDWMKNSDFGQLMLLLVAAPRIDQSFLDDKLRPTNLRAALPTAAKKLCDKALLNRLKARTMGVLSSSAAMASMWAWPLPVSASALDSMLSRFPGSSLPCRGRPFFAVDLARLLAAEKLAVDCCEHKEQSFTLCIDATDTSGRTVRYRIKVRVQAVDSDQFEGSDGTGRPLDSESVKACRDDSDAAFYQQTYPRVLAAATRKIEHIRMKHEWNQLEHTNTAPSEESEHLWTAGDADPTVDDNGPRHSASKYCDQTVADTSAVSLNCSETTDVEKSGCMLSSAPRVSGASQAFNGLPFVVPKWSAHPTAPNYAENNTAAGYFAQSSANGRFLPITAVSASLPKCLEYHRTPTNANSLITPPESKCFRTTSDRPHVVTDLRGAKAKSVSIGGFDRMDMPGGRRGGSNTAPSTSCLFQPRGEMRYRDFGRGNGATFKHSHWQTRGFASGGHF